MENSLPRFTIAVIMGLVLLLDGCGKIKQTADTDVDVAAIKSLAEQVKSSYMARDWDRFADSFTDDGIWMPPDERLLVGKDAWWSWIQGWWDKSTVEQMNLSHEEIEVNGDWAFDRYNEYQVVIPKQGGESIEVYFKGVWILRKQDDNSWKISRFIWNYSPAPAGEEKKG